MDRVSIIQHLIDIRQYQKYLEIGTQFGNSFFPIRCQHKYSIDPNPLISEEDVKYWLEKNPYNHQSLFFVETSDSFFRNRKRYIKSIAPFDIVLIDGLHTFEASLNDVLHCLNYISDKGVIIMHDCFPPDSMAALCVNELYAMEEKMGHKWEGEWCGDVWKTILYLREAFSDSLKVSVLDCDYGLGIIQKRDKCTSMYRIDKKRLKLINSLSYNDLIANNKTYLDLTAVGNLNDAINKILH